MMKTKTIVSIAAAAAVASFTTAAWSKGATPEPATEQAASTAKLPVGSWRVTFSNGVVQNCEIQANGMANVVQALRTSDGRAEVKGDSIEIRYDDDRFERWTMKGDEMVVHHWHPIESASEKPPVVGTAQRFLSGGWNNHFSSMKVGRNVMLLANENANFSGISLTLPAGSYPDLSQMKMSLPASDNWNDRISSIRVITLANPSFDSEADNQITFFRDGNFEGESITVTADTSIEALDTGEEFAIRAPLEVHEWGTFTVLQGSNGQPIQWYQTPEKIVDLPPFVRFTTRLGKSGTTFAGMDTVRMETPVLYFYPEEQMDITVSAAYPQGRITEVFPPVMHSNANETVWRGTLLPPDSPELKNVPAATGPTGRHYAAARAVPDAWLFRDKRTLPPLTPKQIAEAKEREAQGKPAHTRTHPIDHFIFYRGAGTGSDFRINVKEHSNTPGSYSLTNRGAAVPKLFALQVRGGQTSWTTLSNLETAAWDGRKTANIQNFTFPAPAGPTEKVAEDIRKDMVEALNAEGLTLAESEAMVATWDNLWFTEPGTRVLAILPQSVADAMVPLKITPVPEKIDRVFVARIELITREQEAVLTQVLKVPMSEGKIAEAAKKFESLQLGRYSAGGMERAKAIAALQVRYRYHEIEHFIYKREEEKRLALKAEAKKQAAVTK